MSAKKIYESAWQRNGLRFRATSEDMLVSKEANDTAADFIKRTIRAIGQDPKTAAILSDIDHPCAAERPLSIQITSKPTTDPTSHCP